MRRLTGKRARSIDVCAFIDTDSKAVDQFTTKPPRHQSQSGAAERENQREHTWLAGVIPSQQPTGNEQ
jgi:hypothetical protein